VSSLIAIILFAGVFALPVITYFVTRKYMKEETSEEWKDKFKTLYDGLKVGSKPVMMYNTIFLVRRLIFAFLICFVIPSQGIQVIINFFMSWGMIMYLIKYRPFQIEKLNKLEIFNEMTILLCNYTLIAFSDISTDGGVKFDFGWWMLALVLANVSTNVGFIVNEVWKQFKPKL